jgi:signal transduction histidine kinase
VFNRPVAWYGDFGVPEARDRFVADREIAGAFGEAIAWSSAVLGVVVLAILVVRWARASNLARRKLSPVLFAGAVLAASLATLVPLAELAPGNPATRPGDTYATVTFGLMFARALVPVGLMIGLVELRMARSAVADLVVELGDTPTPGRLRDALRQALGDATLEVFLADGQGWRDDTGRSATLPNPDGARAVTTLERDGRPVATLLHDPALLDEPGLVAAVSSAVRLAVENERLEAEVRAQLEEVRASRARIVAAGDDARRRLERDLHDGAQQQLVALSLLLRRAQRQASADGDPAMRATLDAAATQLADALGELRALARGIHPAVLTEAGLARALESLATRSSTRVDLHSTLSRRLPASVEATAYFVVSEALANAEKHASASRVRVTAGEDAGLLRVEISDDGAGGADSARGSGLRGLEDRVAAHGGRLTVDSPPQLGTRVRAEIPCAS